MNLNTFKTAFYGAYGAYSAETGGGDLESYGYSKVDGGLWQDNLTGFKAQLYKDAQNNYLLAFAGTEDLQDAYQDVTSYGWGQWQSRKDVILQYFRELEDADQGSINSIHFVGHSLGGALAQYAAYDFAERNVDTEILITTFNGLGGVSGILTENDVFDEQRLANASIRNYFDPSDLVVQLSKHVGGQNANYQLRADTAPVFVKDAHVMSTLEAYINDGIVQTDLQADHNYFDLDDAVPLLQAFSNYTNGWVSGGEHDANTAESVARLLSMLALIPALQRNSDVASEWEALKLWLLDNVVSTVSWFADPVKAGLLSQEMAVGLLNNVVKNLGGYLMLGAACRTVWGRGDQFSGRRL